MDRYNHIKDSLESRLPVGNKLDFPPTRPLSRLARARGLVFRRGSRVSPRSIGGLLLAMIGAVGCAGPADPFAGGLSLTDPILRVEPNTRAVSQLEAAAAENTTTVWI